MPLDLMSVQSRTMWNPVRISVQVPRVRRTDRLIRPLTVSAINENSNVIIEIQQPFLNTSRWVLGPYVSLAHSLRYTYTCVRGTTVLARIIKYESLTEKDFAYMWHVKSRKDIDTRTHVTGFNVKDNLGLELFLPRILFCSSLTRFSCSFLIRCLSSSINRCSSTMANLSSAWCEYTEKAF